jgi:hypothetical protein
MSPFRRLNWSGQGSIHISPNLKSNWYTEISTKVFFKKCNQKEDVSDEAFERRHLSSERLEKKEIRREREIEAYKLYIEKLKKEFPSHFA